MLYDRYVVYTRVLIHYTMILLHQPRPHNYNYQNFLRHHIFCKNCFRLMSIMTSSVPAYLNSLILHGVNRTGKEIGRGAYGRVFEVDYEGTLCAAKEVHALLLQYAQGGDLQKMKDDFLSECQIWSTLRHPCVVQFLGSVILVV